VVRRLILPLVLLLLLASCGKPQAGAKPTDTVSSALGFVAHPGGAQFPGEGDWVKSTVGLKSLIPLNGCAFGVGDFSNGYREVGANWAGAGDCTKLGITPPPGNGSRDMAGENGNGWSGGGLPPGPIVAGPDGSVLTAYAHFERLDPGGRITELAELRGQGLPTGLVRAKKNLVATGLAFVDANTRKPAAWVSDDNGVTERTVVMPQVPNASPDDSPHTLGGEGDNLLATSYSGEPAQVWSSIDGGGSWVVSTLPKLPEDSTINGVLRVAGQWMVYGESQNGRVPDKPLLLTGEPGKWTMVDPGDLGLGDIVGATVDRSGNPVLVGETYEPYVENQDTRYCSVVRTRVGGQWKRGELGCGENPVRVVTTLADGRVLIAGNRDLWLRP
jgi:hypothetical protein